MATRNSKKGLGKGLDSLIPMGSEIENITKPVKKAKNEPKTNENGVIIPEITYHFSLHNIKAKCNRMHRHDINCIPSVPEYSNIG